MLAGSAKSKTLDGDNMQRRISTSSYKLGFPLQTVCMLKLKKKKKLSDDDGKMVIIEMVKFTRNCNAVISCKTGS